MYRQTGTRITVGQIGGLLLCIALLFLVQGERLLLKTARPSCCQEYSDRTRRTRLTGVFRLRGGNGGFGGSYPGSRAYYFDDEGAEKRPPSARAAPLRAGKDKHEGDDGWERSRDGSEWTSDSDSREGPIDESVGEVNDGQNVDADINVRKVTGEPEEFSIDSKELAGDDEVDGLEDDPEYQRIMREKEPHEFDSDEEGYNLNPFRGVRMKNWFMAENVDPPSEDPRVRALDEALWVACDNGDADEALRLIQEGAEVNAADPWQDWDWSALMHACAPMPAAGLPNLHCNESARAVEDKRLRLVDCLVEHGARIDVADIYGDTPLHYAAVRGYPHLAQRLIELGVDLHRENMYGCSAQRIAEINQKENPGCWDAAEVIAAAGGYDAGWPDRGPEVTRRKHMGPVEKEWIRKMKTADWTGEREDAERQRSLRRLEREAAKLDMTLAGPEDSDAQHGQLEPSKE